MSDKPFSYKLKKAFSGNDNSSFKELNTDIETVFDSFNLVSTSKIRDKNIIKENVKFNKLYNRKEFSEYYDEVLDLSRVFVQTQLNSFEDRVSFIKPVYRRKKMSTLKTLRTRIEKKKFYTCSECPLKNEASVPFETNAEDNIKVLIIGEAPADEEVKQSKPFVGRSGKLIREVINKHPEITYLIANTVFCYHKPSNKPTQEEYSFCKPILKEIISHLPNLERIIIVGKTAFEYILGKKGSIVQYTGTTFFPPEGSILPKVPVGVVYHPSYALRSGKAEEFKTIFEKLFIGKTAEYNNLTSIIKIMNRVEEEYTLVDIQYFKDALDVIFRGKSRKKYVYTINRPNYVFYYSNKKNTPAINEISNLKEVICPYSKRFDYMKKIKGKIYQGDYSITSLYANKYYSFKDKKESDNIPLRVLIFDIENYVVDSDDTTKNPVVSVSIYDTFNDEIYILYDKNIFKNYVDTDKVLESFRDKTINILPFDNEKALLKQFFKIITDINPDVITNWFLDYDVNTIVGRYKEVFKKLPMVNGKEVIHNSRTAILYEFKDIALIDFLYVYKSTDREKKSKYTLDNIAEIELGDKKVKYTGTLQEFMFKDPTQFLIYNIKDTILVWELNKKKRLIEFVNTLRKVAKTSWANARNLISIPLVDSIIMSKANEMGLTIQNVDRNLESTGYEGAFVLQPRREFSEWLVTYDLNSLYPHVMSRYNLDRSTYYLKVKDKEKVINGSTVKVNPLYYIIHKPDEISPNEMVEVIFNPDHDPKERKITVEELTSIIKEKKLIPTITGVCTLSHKVKPSIIYLSISELYNMRKHYQALKKKDKKNSLIHSLYELSYKNAMNTIYGVQGNVRFRLFNKDIAETITRSAKEVSKFTAEHTKQFLDSLIEEREFTNVKVNPDFYFKNEFEKVQYMDTDSVFVEVKDLYEKLDRDKFIGALNKILEYYNNTLLPILIKKHMLDPSDQIFNFQFKMEKIISAAIMPKRKTYVLHVVHEDGEWISKLMFKGISVVRSDYPSWTKGMLKELVEKLLIDNIDRKELTSWLLEKKKEVLELIKSGDFSISRPLSVGKDIEQFKTVSEVVKGALTWNYLIYDHFKIMDKGYHFYITDINDEKLLEISSKLHTLSDVESAKQQLMDHIFRLIESRAEERLNEKTRSITDNSIIEKKVKALQARNKKRRESMKISDSILVPVEFKGNEKILDRLPADVFIINVEKMYNNAFYSRLQQVLNPEKYASLYELLKL